MKKFLQKIVFSVVVVIATAASVYAQVPQGFNFQAVARGADGEILAEQNLGVQVSVIKGTETGNPVYTETHSVTTNPLGLIQLVIGEGTPADGETFAGVDFGNDNYFVKLAIDVSGGTDYEDLGTTRLLSVPYALVAKKSIEGGGSGSAITEYSLNTSEGDTSFIIKATGTKTIAGALKVRSETNGQNRGVDARVVSASGNEEGQLGIYGRASGEGSGDHFGTYGLALGSGVGDNYGSYGYALGTGKYNYGSFGYATGEGNGDEGEDYGEGSINFGGYGYARGNSWNNTGLEGHAAAEEGKVNYGVSGLSQAGTGESVKNHGIAGRAFGPGINYGVYGWAGDGVENYAGFFDGDVKVNGNLTVSGNLNYSGSVSSVAEYNLNTANADSSFQVNVSGTKSGTAFIGLSNTGGVNSGVEGKALSGTGNSSLQVGTYGEAQGEGSGQHMGLYGYSKSNGKYNFGVYGSAKGAGDGTEIAIGNETETDGNGSFNIAGGFYSSGNINGNLGAEGVASGNIGSRVNIGVEGGAKTSANSRNLGVSAYAENSQLENVAFFGRAQSNSARNIGIRVIVNNGLNGANVGIESVADTAAILNGFTEINGNLKVNGTITETSDRNLKENIKPIENGLSTIMKLNPSSYNFRGNGEYKGLKLAQGMHFGLIAQEVEMVLPSLVQNNKHTYLAPVEGVGPNNPDEKTEIKNMEYKTMNYTELIPVLIKAMQEQQKEIEELKAKLKDLKQK